MIAFCLRAFVAPRANDTDAYVPEWWAMESIAVLEETMVAGLLCHRDFENTVQKYGDVVNTRQPQKFTAKRKTSTDNVTVQDATATNVAVPLNQLLHTSFILYDADVSKAMKDLVNEFLRPALIAQAKFVDQVVLGQYPQFLTKAVGGLGLMSSSNAKAKILDARNALNNQLCHMSGRNMIWSPNAETVALNTDIFLQANTVGDDGTALREASLGRKLGFDHWMSQNMASVTATDKADGGEINNAAGYVKGTTSFTVDGIAEAIGVGTFITIEGDMTPLRVVSTTGGATPTTIVVAAPGIKTAVVDNADITVYDPAAVNLAAGYAAAYAKEIIYDGATLDPVVGQMCSFGLSASAALYTIVQVDTSAKTIVLDRPLEASIADNAVINLGPPGDYNLAFHRNAIALVVRPLAAPLEGIGARSAVVNHNGFSMRATITYDGNKQGTLVTLDMLFGIKVLDVNLGTLLCA